MTTGPTDTANQAGLGQEVFGPYLVYERLGVGGMATVHRAREHGIEGFERIVALKRLLPHLAEDASFVKSFVREAKLASLLRHANIVQLYELGRVNTTYFISMELIDGRDIRRILRQARKVTGPPTINVTLSMLIQLCDALDYAHSRCDDDTGEPLHLVHRDVSPSNLLVTKSGHLKVIDFGIAKAQSNQLRTATGRVKGKLAYMAPEAIAGKELDARSDIFSAGVIAHELLTARPLFASKNEYQTLLKVQKGDILPPSTFNQACPPELDAIVLKALSRDPEQRWMTAAEMRDALHEVRIRYHVSATNREVSSWCEWAFSMEAPGNNFSGPMVTDSLGAMPSQSRSPLPLPSGQEDFPPHMRTPTGMTAVPRNTSPIRAVAQPVAGHGDEEEAADVAWGGAQEADSGQPVVLDDVRDHSHRAPGVAAALAAHEGSHGHTPTGQRALHAAAALERGGIQPARFPHGSSDDAVPTGRRARTSGHPAVEAAPDTERHPLVEASSFGAGMLASTATQSNTTRNVLIGAAVAAVLGVVLFLAFGRGGDGASASADKATKDGKGGPGGEVVAETGKLKFMVQPNDAKIEIAGEEPHTGDWTVEIEAGKLQVVISRDGYQSYVQSIELSPGETQTFRVVLEKATGDLNLATLTVDSNPQGLTVVLDGQDIGKTPLNQQVSPGPHTVALKDGTQIKWKESFDAVANAKFAFNPDMSESKQKEREQREQRLAAVGTEKRPPRVVSPTPTPTRDVVKEETPTEPTPVDTATKTKIDSVPAPKVDVPKVVTPPAPPVPEPKVEEKKVEEKKEVPKPPQPKVEEKKAPPPPAAPKTVRGVKRVSGDLSAISFKARPNWDNPPSSIAAKLCINAGGSVTSAKVLTKMPADLLSQVSSRLKSFKYQPYKEGGVAIPVCFAENFKVSK
jgi:serine/threonine protein kinase